MSANQNNTTHHHGILDKVRDAFSPHRPSGRESSRERGSGSGTASLAAEEEHRGRSTTGFVSTGRGGAGNIIRSPSRDPKGIAQEEEDARRIERSLSRDRQGRSHSHVRMGRGGAGNYVSPAREDPAKAEAERAHEERVLAESIAREDAHPHPTGRGGAGNFVKHLAEEESEGYKDSEL